MLLFVTLTHKRSPMKFKLFSLLAIILSILSISSCKKGGDTTTATTTNTNVTYCNNVVSIYGADSIDIAIPTAFSPNGDGKNDLYRPVIPYPNKIKSLSITVYNDDGSIAYQSNSSSSSSRSGWDGFTTTGAKNPGYRFNVSVSFTKANGQTVDTCTYVYLLRDSGAGCLNDVATDKANYIFEDQIDPFSGKAIYSTYDILCN